MEALTAKTLMPVSYAETPLTPCQDGKVGEEAEHEDAAARHGALLHDTQGHRRLVALEVLHDEPRNQEDREEDQEKDDAPRVPRVLVGAAPLQGEEDADDPVEEEAGPREVELGEEAFDPGEGVLGSVGDTVAIGDVDEKEDGGEGDATEGEVDPETPSYEASQFHVRCILYDAMIVTPYSMLPCR
jgi:hypothetical protein